MSPVNWLTDEQYAQAPHSERALAWADYASSQKVREIGVNRGPWVKRFLATVGLGEGYAWCAAFVSWCLLKAGRPDFGPLKGRGAVRNWKAWAERNGRLVAFSQVKRGDLGGWVTPKGTGHLFLIRGKEEGFPSRVATIEGNTNDAGSREGDGVYKRDRAVRPDFFFVRVS